jgi:amino acid permease
MELQELILRGIDYLKAEPIIAIIIIAVIAVLFYFRRKAMLRITVTFLVLAIAYYLVTYVTGMTSSSVSQKETLIEKSETVD